MSIPILFEFAQFIILYREAQESKTGTAKQAQQSKRPRGRGMPLLTKALTG